MNLYRRTPMTTVITFLLGVLPVLTILSMPVAFADVETAAHGGGSKCYICHVDNYSAGKEAYLHNMTSGFAWSECSNSGCHAKANFNATGSVHEEVSCRGCHAPLHVSLYGSGAGAWLFVNRVSGEYNVTKPTPPITWDRQTYFFDSTNDSTTLGATISGWGGEIHWAWTNISGSAAGISSGSRYLVCFNCHFITTDPAQAGLIRMIEGRVMIAIPEFTLRLSPHAITESALREAATETNQLVIFKSGDIRTISGILVGIGIIGAVLWRRRTYSV